MIQALSRMEESNCIGDMSGIRLNIGKECCRNSHRASSMSNIFYTKQLSSISISLSLSLLACVLIIRMSIVRQVAFVGSGVFFPLRLGSLAARFVV